MDNAYRMFYEENETGHGVFDKQAFDI